MRPLWPSGRRWTVGVVVAAGMTACSLDPDYQRPASPVAAAYPEDGTDHTAARGAGPSADAIAWRDFFKDPRLQALIALGLANNRDLRVATLNIAQAQAQYRVQQAALFPGIEATAAPEIEDLPAGTIVPTPGTTASTGTAGAAGAATGSTQSLTSGGAHHSIYRYDSVGLGFTAYELDVFGRLRSLSRAAFETYLEQDEQRRSVQISLVAEIATGYLSLLADQELLRLSEATIASQSESYRLTKLMLDHGTTTLLSLRQVEQLVDSAKADRAQDRRMVAKDEHALTLLLGAPIPADLPAGTGLTGQGLLADLPAGLPSELLDRRPDVLAAEHALLSANADIGVARAAFFPSITLTASDGVASNALNHLFTRGATTWMFAPEINLPIFTWGRIEGNLDYAKRTRDVAVATYEKAIQTAFQEVSDGLAARGTYVEQLHSEQELADAAADGYRLAMMRFRGGVDNFLAALDSQRTLITAQQTVVTIRQAQLTNLVTLYKALGGGWQESPAVPTD